MPNEPRGLKDISSEEFLKAYNDPTLSNQGVVDKLQCGNWNLIGVRLRSIANQLRTTMHRTGGMNGEHRPLTAAELKAKDDKGAAAREWLAANSGGGGGTSAPQTEAEPGDRDVEVPPAPPGEAQAGPGGGTGVAESIGEFSFLGEMSGQKLRFRGPTVTEATNALMAKLREQNFSKIQITDARSGRVVGLNEIENGGSYKITKQLTAADFPDQTAAGGSPQEFRLAA